MRIVVRLFAMLRTREGSPKIEMELGDGATLATLLEHYFADRPDLSQLRSHLRFARGGEMLEHALRPESVALHDGDEIALLPPASGGASGSDPTRENLSRDPLAASLVRLAGGVKGGVRIARILPAPLDADLESRLEALVGNESDGAIVSFTGRTRATPGSPAPGEEEIAARFATERVTSLEYEAAPGLAEAALAAICDRILADSAGEIGGIAVVHAEGIVPLGGASLVAVIAAPHRVAAYVASRRLIDELKRDVPIWKLERFASGEVWSANAEALDR